MTGADAGTWRKALAEDHGSRHLTTLDGWREFTTAEARPPDLPDGPQWEAMTEADRELYDEYRLDYHTRLAAAATSTLRQVVTTGRRLTLLNRHAVSARRGMILSGAAGTGRTTAVTQFGKTHETIDRLRLPGIGDRIPVIYVTVPPAATPRMLAVEFARFLGLPLTARADITGVIEAVCGVAVDARVSVVCVGEIHNLQLATRSGAEVSDTLKYFSERIRRQLSYSRASTSSARACSPAPAEARSPAGSPSSPPSLSRSQQSGRAWSPPWMTRSGCTATSPAPWPGSASTSTAAPAG
ncbi:MAG TPA: ATP-binding protein [Streptosporangiaceae bacterium]|nr:ATP-binding protein [Streptosporangiaceae bacterium]